MTKAALRQDSHCRQGNFEEHKEEPTLMSELGLNVLEWKNRNTEHLHASCQQIVLIIKRAKAKAGAVVYSK